MTEGENSTLTTTANIVSNITCREANITGEANITAAGNITAVGNIRHGVPDTPRQSTHVRVDFAKVKCKTSCDICTPLL